VKNLDTIKFLWEYCSYCYICKDNCRDISIIVGPRPSFLSEEIFTLISFKKSKNFLMLKIKAYKKIYNFTINCNTNDFKIKNNENLNGKFFFYLHGSCINCDSYANTLDIDIDFNNKKLKNIGIEQERILISDLEYKYLISIFYQLNSTLVYKWLDTDESSDLIIKINDKGFKIPIVDLDLSDQKATINKINKFLLLF